MPRFLFAFFALPGLGLCLAAPAADRFLVSDSTAGSLHVITDVNGDGDALDPNEHRLWADGFSAPYGLAELSSTVFAVEGGEPSGENAVVRLRDTNGDGDALDTGERAVWALGLDSPRGVAVAADGVVYVADSGTGELWRFRDLNADGDALDAGERMRHADGVPGLSNVVIGADALYVASSAGDSVRRLRDHNQDGDALDVGENVAVTPVYSVTGLLVAADGSLLFSVAADDVVYQALDRNMDGDFLDIAETVSYADRVFGGIDGPREIAALPGGGHLLAAAGNGKILWLRDANGDGDALDVGDVRSFAQGFTAPISVLQLASGGDPASESAAFEQVPVPIWAPFVMAMLALGFGIRSLRGAGQN